NDLADFVNNARKRYDLPAPMTLGYSNGANIAAAVLQLRPEALAGAILLRAMVPLRDAPTVDLAGKPVLIVSGQFDPIIPTSNAQRLAVSLTKAGANVQHRTLPIGHQLSQADLTVASEWLHGIEATKLNSAA
ncbi:alpha/beta hydrolase, partial [Salinisphaera sp. USBA-960]|nr:alpha/beta hydrolase [Salifodinibacter halophilus]